MNHTKLKFVTLSVLVHTLLILCIALHFKKQQGVFSIDQAVVNSYSYSSIQQVKHNFQVEHSKHAVQRLTNKTTINTIASHKSSYLTPADQNHSVEIINILHKAIAEKQIYPEAAIELHQSGTVKIGFTLTPTGQLKNIHIEQSSGHDVIDEAAMTAARSISDISEASKYLQRDSLFIVDVVFTL